MMARWQELLAKFDALSRRERLMVLAACLMVIIAGMDALLVAPVTQRIKTETAQMAAERAQVVAMQQQLQMLESTPLIDPDAQHRQQLDEVLAQLQQANESLERMQQKLISPEKMPGLLEDILHGHGQLKLLALKTLPVSEIKTTENVTKDASGEGASNAVAAGAVYRHGVSLKVQGRYLDLMAYLQTLEKMPWHMLWGSASLTADAYPQSTLTLTIYTLSLDKVWLSI